MEKVLPILFGAALPVAVSLALGSVLVRPLRGVLYRGEAAVIAFLSGAACLSLVVFFLCVIHQAKWWVFFALGILPLGSWLRRERGSSGTSPAPRGMKLTLFLFIFVPFFVLYLVNALAPEISPDGTGYHLGDVLLYWRAHGFDWSHRSMYAAMPQGMEMLFLMAFSFGGHSAAALVHFAFFAALPVLIAFQGVRAGSPRAGLFAAAVVFTCPVAGIAGISAYNDLALATLVFAVFHLLQVWSQVGDSKLLLLIGLLAGFAYSIKYTGAVALIFALLFVRSFHILFPAAIVIAPWAIRNWIWLGNPLAPFFNRWFPNRWFEAAAERSYLADLRHWDRVPHFWAIPFELAFRGGKIPGIIGPVFLLAPLALLALRRREGRGLLLAAVVFGLPAYWNSDSRFLIPALPFVVLAMGLALAQTRGVLPALALFEALVCWPSNLKLYCDDWAWHIREIPVRAALRREPEAKFLRSHVPDYAMKDPIRREVPEGQRIFSFAGRAEAYLDREIVVGYESSLGLRLQDALQAKSTREVKAEGIHFLLVDDADTTANDMKQNPKFWGITEVATANGTHLYRID